MFAPRTIPSLKRRLTANFLLCGTLLVAGLAVAAAAGPLAEKMAFGPAAAAAALAGLLVTSTVLRRTVAPVSEIDDQLRELVGAESGDVELRPIVESGPVSAAWNRLQERASSRRSLEKLEERVSGALGENGSQSSLEVLNSLPDGVAITDQQGQVTKANRAFRALLGLSGEEDATGKSIATLLRSAAGDGGADANLTGGSGQLPSAFEVKRGKELSEGVLKAFRFALFEGDRESSQQVWLVRDVTQQKLADEMRTQFLQTATHELRTPLMNICAYAETLELTDDLDVEQQKEFCNIINAEAKRLSRFIDELLDVSRMEAGAMSLARHETDLERLLDEVVQKVRPQMDQKRIEFEARIPAKLPKLTIDKDKIAAALVNLLGNAAKYTPDEGRVKLVVEAGEREVEFHVEDTGYGISAEELPKVFERFFRSADERVHQISGSGLGLAFTNEVVRLHGGRIDVHSELNRGTKFNLILPMR